MLVFIFVSGSAQILPKPRGTGLKISLDYLVTGESKVEEVLRMYAIIETGGKQYKVEEGQVFDVEKLDVEAGDEIEFDVVKAVSKDDSLEVGQPTLEDATVTADVVDQIKGDKVIVFKYKPKNNYRKKQGHRQPYTRVKVKSIDA